jgi:L-lysine 2,3-aminomutase
MTTHTKTIIVHMTNKEFYLLVYGSCIIKCNYCMKERILLVIKL